jgi:hypothetical protein
MKLRAREGRGRRGYELRQCELSDSVHFVPNPSKTNLFGRLAARPRNLFRGGFTDVLPATFFSDFPSWRPCAILRYTFPFRRRFLFLCYAYYILKSTCGVRVMMNAKDWEATNEDPLVGAIHHPSETHPQHLHMTSDSIGISLG